MRTGEVIAALALSTTRDRAALAVHRDAVIATAQRLSAWLAKDTA